MVNFKEEIAKIIGQVLDGLTEDEIKDMVEVPQDDKMGDYAFPCFKLAKTLRKAPPLIAADIAAKIEGNPLFEKVEQVNAYVNMFVSKKEFIRDVVTEVLDKKEDFGKSEVGGHKTVIVEFSSPNIAKPFHIGHIRSTVIGNSHQQDIQGHRLRRDSHQPSGRLRNPVRKDDMRLQTLG